MVQVFAPSADPALSAAALDDGRVRKMVVETAQVLSAVALEWNPDWHADHGDLYRRPTSGGEVVAWAGSADGAFEWLACHGMALVWELDLRGISPGKLLQPRHICELMYTSMAKQAVFRGDRERAHRAAPPMVNRARNQREGLDFTHIPDAHLAYRLYLAERWSREDRHPEAHRRPVWTNRQRPSWGFATTEEAS